MKTAATAVRLTARKKSPAIAAITRVKKTASSPIAKLMPTTQFLYELHLATLEIAATVEGAKISGNFRAFKVPTTTDKKQLLQSSAYIRDIDGIESDYNKLLAYNVTRAFNQYITHWFYPYKGKFHPQMVRALANIIGMRQGETLLDPFIGSGTAAVEGALLGLKTIGFDVSPLCALVSKTKANAIHHLPAIEKQYASSCFAMHEDDDVDLQSALSNSTEGFFLLARLIALSDKVRRRRDFAKQLEANTAKMLESVRLMKRGCKQIGVKPPPADIRMGDARCLPLPDESIDGVITSPPYSIALNYVENDAHSLRYLGLNPDECGEDFIGVRGSGSRRTALYEDDMQKVYAEIFRVLRPGRMAVIVLGNATVNGVRLPTVQNCEDTFEAMGARRIHKIDKIIFGLYNVMMQEDILVFQKT